MAVAVICEFNPFHNGHKYLLWQAKNLTGEPVIAVMSGSFTQRGEAAICDKFTRAKAALQNGADLVLELPTVFSVANAQRFAAAGVETAKAFECTNFLAFGCETDDLCLLSKAAQAIENEEVQKLIKAEMKKGSYYPKAFENSVRQVFGDKVSQVLASPNNVLAAEYLRNLEGKIKPIAVKRTAVAHDSTVPNAEYASASLIRELLQSGKSAEKYMPLPPSDITRPENLERIILYRLRAMSTDDFLMLPDVGEGIENRIVRAVSEYNSLEEIITCVKTKRYTHARIRRIIACALLGITERLQTLPIEHVRVLGFTPEGAKLLRLCKKTVITSASQGLRLGGSISQLLEKDIFAADTAALAYDIPKCRGLDFTTPILKL